MYLLLSLAMIIGAVIAQVREDRARDHAHQRKKQERFLLWKELEEFTTYD